VVRKIQLRRVQNYFNVFIAFWASKMEDNEILERCNVKKIWVRYL
jgi:hypothetical protein